MGLPAECAIPRLLSCHFMPLSAIRDFFARWWCALQAPSSGLDAATRMRVVETSNVFLRLFLNAWILMGLALAIASALVAPYVLYAPCIVLFTGLAARYAMYRGHLRVARWMFIAPVSAALMVLAPLLNGIRTPILVSVPMLVLMSGWLLGRRVMLYVTAAYIALFVLMWQAELQGLWVMTTPLRSIEVWILVWVFIIGLTAIVTYSLISNYELDFQREAVLQQRLASVLHFTESVLLLSPIPMRVFDHTGQCINVNEAYEQLIGVPRATLLSQNFHSLDMWKSTGLLADGEQALVTMRPVHREVQVQTSTGRDLWLDMHLLPIDSDGVRMLLAQVIDITEPKRLAQELEHFAFHDPLTQLPNRRLFFDRLEHAVQRCRRTASLGAVLLLDLNRFKVLNDTHGHEVGDQLLVQVATRLRSVVRDSDTVARLGGDEFVVLLEHLGADASSASRHAGQVADKIRGVLSTPYQLGAVHHTGSASVGICVFSADSHPDTKAVVHAADAAMYEIKRAHHD